MDQMEPETQANTESSVYSCWLHYLTLCLVTIFFTRLLGIILPIGVPKIAQFVLPSCRTRRAAVIQRDSEIRDLRLKMSQLNMVDNFAVYSKLQRRLKFLEREQNEAERNQLGTTLVSSLIAQIFRHLLHGILIAWLFSRTPRERLSENQLMLLKDTQPFFGWTAACVHYVPGWLITIIWISLCETTLSSFLTTLQEKIEGSN